MPNSPTRRTLLQTGTTILAVAVAGCSELPSGVGGDRPEEESPTTTATESRTTAEPREENTDTGVGAEAETEAGVEEAEADSTSTEGNDPEPIPYPEKPKSFTTKRAVEYMKAYERAYTYNEQLYRDDATHIETDCGALFETAADGGYYGFATCDGSATYADSSVVDVSRVPATAYFVSATTTRRVGENSFETRSRRRAYRSDDTSENRDPPVGFRIYNLSGADQRLSVTVTYRGESTNDEVLDVTYSLATETGIQQYDVTARTGTYTVKARLRSGAVTTYEWTVSKENPPDNDALVIYVTPTNGVRIEQAGWPRLINYPQRY